MDDEGIDHAVFPGMERFGDFPHAKTKVVKIVPAPELEENPKVPVCPSGKIADLMEF